MKLRNAPFLLISFFVFCTIHLRSQSLANYVTTRTTGITYSSIVSTGNAMDSWRNAGTLPQDDNRSNATDIGFDFWYNGTRYTQFSVSTNGFVDFSSSAADGGATAAPYGYDNTYFTANGDGTWLSLAPMYDDMTAQGGTDTLGNSIKYLVTGTAPNRVLTIEWIDMAVYQNTTPSLNFQVKLYETTGVIDFVYGTMAQGTANFTYTCGINAASLSNTPTAAQLLCQQTANTNTFNNGQQNGLTTIPATNSQIRFTPPLTTPAPSGTVSFTGVTQTGMTVNWPNWCTNEVGYVLYGSLDNVNFSYVTQTAANATNFAVTGLLPGTLYYWKVHSVTEGALSTALTGSQATTAAGTVISITTGNWNATSTWNCSCIPTAADNVTIANTHTVTVNVNTVCNTLTIGQGASGILRIGNNNTARTMAVNSNITINAGGKFDVNTGSNTTHELTLKGNLTNNGTLDFATDANSLCDITFTKNGNQTISGSGATNDFNRMTLNMGSSVSNTLEITTGSFTVPTDFLTLTSGMFKLSTTGTVNITPYTGLATIPNPAGMTINSATATVAFGAGIDLYGSLIVNNGAVTIGNASDESVASNGGIFQIFGGTTKIAGCYYSADINTLAKFTISGGTLTLPTSGSTSTTIAPFQIDGVGSTFNMSGGTIIIERKGGGGSNLGYRVTGVTNSAVTGGTLQMGNGTTPASQTMKINSSCRVGNLLVNSANATAILDVNPLPVTNNITISTGVLNANNLNMSLGGNWTNNSTFTPGTGLVNFNGTTGQTIGGSVVTTFSGLRISDAAGVTQSINTNVSGALTFIAGVINTGTNKVTITTTGSVTGAGTGKFVNGFLEKNVATGSGVTRNYEVGFGSTDYLPVSLTFANVSAAGNVTAKVNNGDHPNIGTSCIDPAQSVNRYWQLSTSGLTFTNYSATCTFIGVGSDADAGSTTSQYFMSVYNGTAWTMLTQGTATATTNQGLSATALGALQIGEKFSPVITTEPADKTVCNNTTATFTVVATGVGSYQWQQNTGSGFVNLTNGGIYSGVTTATLTINPATTSMSGYTYRCILTSSVCGGTTTSATATLTVNPSLPVSVVISASPSTTICAGTNVTFTATPTNGGTTPSYQWKVNGVNVGTNSPTYSNSTLTNGNTVTCVLTSNATCPTGNPATSNTITMTVNPNLPVSVSIAASPSTTICAGTSVTFTATPTNGGTTPAYQWKLNGVNVGTNSPTYTNAALTNGNTITCVLTSNATCATGNPATSNTVTMTVNPNLPVSVSIAASSTTICPGTNVTFTATPTNGGTTPSYQWKLNGGNVGTNSTTYSNSALVNGDVITCVLTSNATPCATGSPATSNTVTMTVNAALPVSVSITASPSSTVCAGTSVTFTATPVNGGGTPSYQWKLNGVNVGTNSPTYTNAALTNGNTVTCVLTSAATCATGSPATSNTITMTVNPNLPVSVSIAASPSTTICTGTSVTFTATPTNGGTTPVYQWKLNGTNVGTNSTAYSNASLVNGDVVTCVLTSNATCATGSPATSNTITITVNPDLPVSVSIAASPSTTICSGTNVTFTATPTNGGTTPSYQWKLNGVNVGTNSATYSNAALLNSDVVTCVLTSNATPCATGSPATSNAVTMTVNPNLPVSVSIAASPSITICAGTNVTFTATPTNGGTTPSYQWKLNGVNVGTNSATYSNAALLNGDVVTCVLTSNATPCATGSPATSNAITMTVNPDLPVSVSIAASPSITICAGTNVTFTATPTNGGTTPSYQWQVNGVNVGTNLPTFSSTTLTNGNAVTCILTSNATCATGNPATSNTITMTVNAGLPVSVSIAASPSATICSGTTVTFTATPTNGGTTPVYQWQLNGTNVGTNSTTYSNAALSSGDVVTCILTSNAICATGSPATSNAVAMTVNPNLPVSIAIGASPAGAVCAGTTVIFTATPTNGGTTPAYQWKLNGTNVGISSNTYTNAALVNGDAITCVLTSNASCVTGNPATSNTITQSITTGGTWIGANSTDWSDPANWCGGVPATTTNVTIPSGTPFAPVLSTGSNCKDLSIATGVTVDLNDNILNVYGAISGTGLIRGSVSSALNIAAGSGSGGTFYLDQSSPGNSNSLYQLFLDRTGSSVVIGNTLNVTNAINIAAGTLSAGNNLTLVSNASGTARVGALSASADITGNVTMQRYIPAGTDGWMFICAPVTGATLQQWDDDFITGGFPGSQYPTTVTNSSINGYDETWPGIYDDGYTVPNNITDPIVPRAGYWAYIMNTPLTIDVKGPLLKHTQTFPVTYTDDPSQPAIEDGWNLLANPYPSTIDWDAAGWTKTNVNNAVYMYSPTLDQYTSYVGGIGTNGGSNLIASSQAFLVQTNAPSPVLTLSETAKDATDGLFIRASSGSSDDLLKLDLTGSGYSDETVIHFNSGATAGFDLNYDALKFFSFNTDVAGIASVLDTFNMSVNTFPELTSDLSIPVKVKVGISGTYTINVDTLTQLPEGACVIMHDLKTGIQTDLRTTTSYSFYIADTTRYPRFIINISKPLEVSSLPSSCGGTPDGMATAHGNGSGPWNYTWQNAGGTVVQTHPAESGADTLFNVAAGVYTVTVTGNSGYCGTLIATVEVTGASPVDVDAVISNASCSGVEDGAIMIASIEGGNDPYTFAWSNGPSTADNLNVGPGAYTLTVTDSTGCVQAITYIVPQNSTITAGFTMSSDTVYVGDGSSAFFHNTSTGITGASFTWDFGDGSATDNKLSPSHEYTIPGTYTVTLIATNGDCADTTTQVIVVLPAVSTGFSETISGSGIKTATNESSVDLIFNMPSATNVVVEVYSSLGQLVIDKISATVHKSRLTLDFSDKRKGIYYIRITMENGDVVTKKIVRS